VLSEPQVGPGLALGESVHDILELRGVLGQCLPERRWEPRTTVPISAAIVPPVIPVIIAVVVPTTMVTPAVVATVPIPIPSVAVIAIVVAVASLAVTSAMVVELCVACGTSSKVPSPPLLRPPLGKSFVQLSHVKSPCRSRWIILIDEELLFLIIEPYAPSVQKPA